MITALHISAEGSDYNSTLVIDTDNEDEGYGDQGHGSQPRCLYCKTVLRKSMFTKTLCAPCKELYAKHFIRRDCGRYVKNTAKQRSDILSDESASSPKGTENDDSLAFT